MALSFRHCFPRRTADGPASRASGFGKYRLISPPGEPPYFASLDTPLLKIGKDIIDIRDACESFCITGGIGSGKTSTSITALLTAYLQAGFGGVYLCAKPGAADLLRELARKTNRYKDIVPFHAGEDSARVNIMDAASEQFRGDPTALVGLMSVVISAGRKASGTGGSSEGENRFFTEAAMKDAAHVFPILQAVEGSIKMRSLYKFLTSVPATPAEAQSQEWMQTSYCGQTIGKLANLHAAAVEQGLPEAAKLARIWTDCATYFLGEVARLDSRPKTSVTATFSNNIYHFLHGDLNRLFCTDTTPDATPQAARRGKILLVDLPALTHGAGAVIAAVIVKYLCAMAWQSEKPDRDTRPVFIMADEAQTYLDATDADTLATGREARISTVYATQDIPTIYAKLSGRDVADSLLAKFGARIAHANTCTKSNEMFATMIGKSEHFHLTKSRSTGSSTGAGGNRHDESGGYNAHTGANQNESESTSGYMDWEFPPSDFALLKTGGPRNKQLVEAVIIRNGRRWRTSGKHWMLAELKQS